MTGVATVIATPKLGDVETQVGKQKGGVLGIMLRGRPEDVSHHRYGPVQALAGGAARTWDTLKTTVFVVNRLVHGQVPADQLRGPLGIAQTSGVIAHMGAEGEPNAHGPAGPGGCPVGFDRFHEPSAGSDPRWRPPAVLRL